MILKCNEECTSWKVDNWKTLEWGGYSWTKAEFFAAVSDRIQFEVYNYAGHVGLSAYLNVGDIVITSSNRNYWSYKQAFCDYWFRSEKDMWKVGIIYYDFLANDMAGIGYHYFYLKLPNVNYINQYIAGNYQYILRYDDEDLTINIGNIITGLTEGAINDNKNRIKIVTYPKGSLIPWNEGGWADETNHIYYTQIFNFTKTPNTYSFLTIFTYNLIRYEETNSNIGTINIIVCGLYCERCDSLDNYCPKCANGYYAIEDNIHQCFPLSDIPINYYLSKDGVTFKPCYEKCETCSMLGNDWINKCNTCYSYVNYFEVRDDGTRNCYTECPEHLYLYDSNGITQCVSQCSETNLPFESQSEPKSCLAQCDNNQFEFVGTSYCADSCEDPFIYQVLDSPYRKCYSDCPENTFYDEKRQRCRNNW
ncbi:MAG: hypothetical protein ACRC42_00500, partial [Mycoplasma sp.]